MTEQQPPNEQAPEEPRRRRRRLRIDLDTVKANWSVSGGLTLAGTGVGALLVTAFAWFYPHQSQVEVPALVGMPRVAAEDQLKNTGLNLLVTSSEVSDQPIGTVLRSDPPARTKIDQGGGVSVVLAAPGSSPSPSAVEAPPIVPQAPAPPPVKPPIAPPPPVVVPPPPVVLPPPVVVPPPPVVLPPPVPVLRQVPNVIGLDRGKAEGRLARDELKVGSVTEEESSQRPQTVLRTDPQPGSTVPSNNRVDLVVAKCSPRSVPYVVGRDLATAKKLLEDSGLRVGRITEKPSYEDARVVLEVTPNPGAAVQCGSAVSLVVAKDAVRFREVPRVVGYPLTEAKRILDEKGFVLGSVTKKPSTQAAQSVVSQQPTPHTSAEVGSAVNLVVATPQAVSEGNTSSGYPESGSSTSGSGDRRPGEHRPGGSTSSGVPKEGSSTNDGEESSGVVR